MAALRSFLAPNAGPFTMDGTRSYLVGTRRVAIIDPGSDHEEHLGAVQAAVEHADEVCVVLTHDHPDHVGGSRKLAAAVNARLVGFGPGAEPLADGDFVGTDAGPLVAVETPGHAAKHLSFHWPDRAAVFVGDLLLGRGETTWLGEYAGCVADYFDSLDRVEALEPAVLYPAHGPPLDDVSGSLGRFREHRHRRLEQLRIVWERHEDASAAELASVLYGTDIPEGAREAATRSVEAMLHHLKTTDTVAKPVERPGSGDRS